MMLILLVSQALWWLLSVWCNGPAAQLDLSGWAPVCRVVMG